MSDMDLERDDPEASPIDQANQLAMVLKRVLEATKLIVIVEVKTAINQIYLIGRVKKEEEKKFIYGPGDAFMRAEEQGMDAFCIKKYFRKDGGRRYGWLVGIGSDDLVSAVEAVIDMIANPTEIEAEASPVDPEEIPMLGANPKKGSLIGGVKGASFAK